MTGAAIVRWWEGEALVLSVHGALDGASAWALRHEMDGAGAREVVIDLAGAEEACDFAAGLLAAWARGRSLRFRGAASLHARLLRAHGLEVDDLGDDDGAAGKHGVPPPARAGGGLGPSIAAGPTLG
jgi:hypothetical protein